MFARLFALFVAVSAIELFLFIEIGRRIGLLATVAIVILTAMLGAWFARMQGLRTLARFQQAISEGRVPHEEVVDGVMILLAAALLLTPGFFTDALGFALLVPLVRAAVRRRVSGVVAARVRDMEARGGTNSAAGRDESVAGRRSRREGRVIDAEVIREESGPDEI